MAKSGNDQRRSAKDPVFIDPGVTAYIRDVSSKLKQSAIDMISSSEAKSWSSELEEKVLSDISGLLTESRLKAHAVYVPLVLEQLPQDILYNYMNARLDEIAELLRPVYGELDQRRFLVTSTRFPRQEIDEWPVRERPKFEIKFKTIPYSDLPDDPLIDTTRLLREDEVLYLVDSYPAETRNFPEDVPGAMTRVLSAATRVEFYNADDKMVAIESDRLKFYERLANKWADYIITDLNELIQRYFARVPTKVIDNVLQKPVKIPNDNIGGHTVVPIEHVHQVANEVLVPKAGPTGLVLDISLKHGDRDKDIEYKGKFPILYDPENPSHVQEYERLIRQLTNLDDIITQRVSNTGELPDEYEQRTLLSGLWMDIDFGFNMLGEIKNQSLETYQISQHGAISPESFYNENRTLRQDKKHRDWCLDNLAAYLRLSLSYLFAPDVEKQGYLNDRKAILENLQ